MILNKFLKAKSERAKMYAVLIDPEKFAIQDHELFLSTLSNAAVDFLFVGGSTVKPSDFHRTISILKLTEIPIVIFPGSPDQISSEADGILLLSLISGRNPELLIGQHVSASKALKKSGIEIIPTGYILIAGGKTTSVQKVSNTSPIDANDLDLITSTALAGEQLGLAAIYLEAGSGALYPVNIKTISMVREECNSILIVGGGINSPELAHQSWLAGADVIVTGNAVETYPGLMVQIAEIKTKLNESKFIKKESEDSSFISTQT